MSDAQLSRGAPNMPMQTAVRSIGGGKKEGMYGGREGSHASATMNHARADVLLTACA